MGQKTGCLIETVKMYYIKLRKLYGNEYTQPQHADLMQ